MKPRTLSIIAGGSYLVIFFAAIFANFFVLRLNLERSFGNHSGESSDSQIWNYGFSCDGGF